MTRRDTEYAMMRHVLMVSRIYLARDPVYVALAGERGPPYMFRGEPCANVGQLRMLLETECGMARSDHLTVTECAVFLRDALRRVMFTCAQGRDGVVTVDPRWAEG